VEQRFDHRSRQYRNQSALSRPCSGLLLLLLLLLGAAASVGATIC
jgi:hypothetical protein